MNYSIKTLFLLFVVISNNFAQDKQFKITEVKNKYAEIVQLYNSSKTKKCKVETITEFSVSSSSEKIPFDQTVEYCELTKDYSVYKASFSGEDWHCLMSYYLKDNKLFFVQMPCGIGSDSTEHKIYYDDKGEIIKIIKNTYEAPQFDTIKTIEITDRLEINKIKNKINDDLEKMLKILNKKSISLK